MGKRTTEKPKRKEKDAIYYCDFFVQDDLLRINHLWARFIISILSIFLLGQAFMKIDNGYFTSVLMFCIPMYFDTSRFLPQDKTRKVIRLFKLGALSVTFIVCVIGLFGILGIETIQGNAHIIVKEFPLLVGHQFPAISLWVLSIIISLLNGADMFGSKVRAEGVVAKSVSR